MRGRALQGVFAHFSMYYSCLTKQIEIRENYGKIGSYGVCTA